MYASIYKNDTNEIMQSSINKDDLLYILYYTSQIRKLEEYCKSYYGYLHREIYPARIKYTQEGDIEWQAWYIENELIAFSYDEYRSYICRYKKQYRHTYQKLLKMESIHIFD